MRTWLVYTMFISHLMRRPKAPTTLCNFYGGRDLTSSFDVVGSYYCSSGALECKFIIGVVLETIKIFHVFEFETRLLVCDGASSNLSAIKQTMGVSGVFGRNPSQADPNAIAPTFANPFNPAKRIYWLICPSHQVLCIVCTCIM